MINKVCHLEKWPTINDCCCGILVKGVYSLRKMIIYDYVSRAKLKSNHIILSLKQEYTTERGLLTWRLEKRHLECYAQILQPQVHYCLVNFRRVETTLLWSRQCFLHLACEVCRRHSFVE